MTWILEPQLDNNGKEVGIAGMRIGWLVLVDSAGRPMLYPGTKRVCRTLVAYEAGELLCHYLNGSWGNLPGQDARQERLEQPYLDAERVPRSRDD